MSEVTKEFDNIMDLIQFMREHKDIKSYSCKIKLTYVEEDSLTNQQYQEIVKCMVDRKLLSITKDMTMYDILVQLAPTSQIVDWLLQNYDKNTVMGILDYINTIEKSIVNVGGIRNSYFDKYVIYELGKESENWFLTLFLLFIHSSGL